jgi:hypothetical protein
MCIKVSSPSMINVVLFRCVRLVGCAHGAKKKWKRIELCFHARSIPKSKVKKHLSIVFTLSRLPKKSCHHWNVTP